MAAGQETRPGRGALTALLWENHRGEAVAVTQERTQSAAQRRDGGTQRYAGSHGGAQRSRYASQAGALCNLVGVLPFADGNRVGVGDLFLWSVTQGACP